MKIANNILLKALGVLLIVAVVIAAGLGGKKSTPISKLAQENSQAYEILEPNSWLGKELPIIDYIDISDKLKTGNWLVLFYHYDCPECVNAIEKLNKTKYQITNAKYNVAIIEVPPYGNPIPTNCLYGRLLRTKEWFITTPVIIFVENNIVRKIWEKQKVEYESLISDIEMAKHNMKN